MSPNVGNFVHDLVEMAKAMETLPTVEARVRELESLLNSAEQRCSDREIALEASRTYAAGLEQKVHDAEVARDDAELRFLEVEDKLTNTIAMAKASRVSLDQIMGLLDPPKPEPVVEAKPEPKHIAVHSWEDSPNQPSRHGMPIAGDPNEDTSHLGGAPVQDQSVADPTSANTTEPLAVAQEHIVKTSDDVNTQPALVQPNPGPYSGKRYYDMPIWVSLEDWLDGGGTLENYDWQPSWSLGSI